jgi:hypothetical protein
MTLFTAVAAAALESPYHGLNPGIYAYFAALEFNVKKNGQYVPALVAKILAKLVLDDPDIVFVDSARQRIHIDDPPTSKADFDAVFSTSTSGGRLSCKFEIQSTKTSFHAIKIGVWELLQAHHVWFKRAPGRVEQTPLVALGFWLNAHPGLASPSVFRTEITQDIEKQYSNNPEVLANFRLPAEHNPVEMYLSRNKIHTEHTDGGNTQAMDTEVLMLYATKKARPNLPSSTSHTFRLLALPPTPRTPCSFR